MTTFARILQTTISRIAGGDQRPGTRGVCVCVHVCVVGGRAPYRLVSAEVAGSMILTNERSLWLVLASAFTSSSLPIRITLQRPRAASSPAADTTRLSLPSGNTMHFWSRRA
eukprot:3510811-Pyramimonas_sp.AAC.1